MTRSDYNSKPYDIRAVDHFYAYCRARAEVEAHRRTLIRAWRTAKRITWTILLVGVFVAYLLIERMSQANSLL